MENPNPQTQNDDNFDNIFEQRVVTECNKQHIDNIEDLCIPLQRLKYALKLYSLLDITQNDEDCDQFDSFINETYPLLLDDYTHLIIQHQHQIYEINQLLLKSSSFNDCDVNQCPMTFRHNAYKPDEIQQNQQQSPAITMNKKLNFYKTIMDSLHFFVFHLFDVGLRVHFDTFKGERKSEIDDDDENKYDKELNKIKTMVNDCKHLSQSLALFRNSSKFTVPIDNVQRMFDMLYIIFIVH